MSPFAPRKKRELVNDFLRRSWASFLTGPRQARDETPQFVVWISRPDGLTFESLSVELRVVLLLSPCKPDLRCNGGYDGSFPLNSLRHQ